MLHIYTGDGKGKTTAGIGLAIRAYGHGKKVAMVFFDKSECSGEHAVLRKLKIPFFVFGVNRIRAEKNFRFEDLPEDYTEAKKAGECAEKILLSKKYDLVVLDEFCSVVDRNLLSRELASKILSAQSKNINLILTGRGCPKWILNQADLVTEMKMKKHYFEKGIGARKGIEW